MGVWPVESGVMYHPRSFPATQHSTTEHGPERNGSRTDGPALYPAEARLQPSKTIRESLLAVGLVGSFLFGYSFPLIGAAAAAVALLALGAVRIVGSVVSRSDLAVKESWGEADGTVILERRRLVELLCTAVQLAALRDASTVTVAIEDDALTVTMDETPVDEALDVIEDDEVR